jgi:hypothetical protein
LIGSANDLLHVEFLERLMLDGEVSARVKLKKYVATFLRNAESLGGDRSRARIVESFAVIYAAARLAIEYKVLNWKVVPTGQAIRKCLEDVLRGLEPGSALQKAKQDTELVEEFLLRLSKARHAEFAKGPKACKDHRKLIASADMLRRSGALLLKAERMRAWFPDGSERKTLVKALQTRKLLIPGRDITTATRQVRVPGLGKARTFFYVFAFAEVKTAMRERSVLALNVD